MHPLFVTAYNLLSTPHKKRALRVAFQLTISSILDFFSIASFLPIILLVINPDLSSSLPWLNKIYTPTGINHSVYVAFILTILSLLFIFIKTKIQIRLNDIKTAFAYAVARDLASRVITRYFDVSYCLSCLPII
jgi:hypothetical protein